MPHTLTITIVKDPETYMDLLYAYETNSLYDGFRVTAYEEQRSRQGMTEAVFTLSEPEY